jgi:hypothetical protein
VTLQARQTNAGLNHFLNTISVNWDTRQEPQTAFHTVTFHVTSSPTWSPPPPAMVPTRLALTGTVDVTDAASWLTLDLLGWLGGPPARITRTFADCNDCVLNLWVLQDQNRDTSADEWLTITSMGRTRYTTDSPSFSGSVPEPGSLTMGLFGAVLLTLAIRRRGRR